MYQHFAALSRAAELPLIVYNVPARTVTDIEAATLARLVTEFPDRIVAVKDSSGVLARVSKYRAALGPGFAQLTGNDDTALAFNSLGGSGCISVTANVAPRLCAEFQATCGAGDYAGARAYQHRLFPLHAALLPMRRPARSNTR